MLFHCRCTIAFVELWPTWSVLREYVIFGVRREPLPVRTSSKGVEASLREKEFNGEQYYLKFSIGEFEDLFYRELWRCLSCICWEMSRKVCHAALDEVYCSPCLPMPLSFLVKRPLTAYFMIELWSLLKAARAKELPCFRYDCGRIYCCPISSISF